MRRAGVALTEALIAISVMIVLFAGVCLFHGVYTQQATNLRLARAAAWASTNPGCTGETTGDETRTFPVSRPLRLVTGRSELTMRARVTLTCNEIPHDNIDLLSALEWSLKTGTQEIIGPFFETLFNVITGTGGVFG